MAMNGWPLVFRVHQAIRSGYDISAAIVLQMRLALLTGYYNPAIDKLLQKTEKKKVRVCAWHQDSSISMSMPNSKTQERHCGSLLQVSVGECMRPPRSDGPRIMLQD